MGSGSCCRSTGRFFFVLSLLGFLLPAVNGQLIVTNISSTPTPAPAPAPPPQPGYNGDIPTGNATLYQELLDTCHGVVIRYSVSPWIQKIFPISKINKTQPYKFESDLSIVNAGYNELQGWELYLGFDHGEIIASAEGVQFVDGSEPPGALVGNGTLITGSDTPNLLTSINTAEDLPLIAATASFVGVEFGVGPGQPDQVPLPGMIALNNSGYSCKKPVLSENTTLFVCCPENSSAIINTTKVFPPRYEGDITIYYDVLQTTDQLYTAQVTINNDNPISMLNHWNLTWTWEYGEFIWTMKGAQTLLQEQDDCLNGPAGVQYAGVDFSQAMSCQSTPTIVDLNEYQAPFQDLPGCCRNGTLLPAVLDPSQTKSVFQLEVYKLLPDSAKRDTVHPPTKWNIGSLQDSPSPYVCGEPRLVSPSEFFTSGLHYNSAVMSWQVTCNLTNDLSKTDHKCCVSFSGYYNSSVIPCPTCACGCPEAIMQPNNMKCNANPDVEAMLLPSYALLLPAANRTVLADALAKLDHLPQPNPMPCPDNCGVSINWHIYSNYANGFSTRMTVFNWEPLSINPWFAAMEFKKAAPGYQDVYSFNGSKIIGFENNPNTTLVFVHGKDGYNTELLGLDTSQNPNVPGKLQSLLSFDKRKTPGLDVVGGDGFPSRVWFNGDECALPDIFPVSSAQRTASGLALLFTVSLLVFALSGPLPWP